MADTAAAGIAKIMVAQSLSNAIGGTVDYSTYISKEPANPIRVFTCYDLDPIYDNCSRGIAQKYFNVQVRLRDTSNNYIAAMDKLDTVVSYFDTASNITESGFTYSDFIITKAPSKISLDDNENSIFTIELRTTREIYTP